MSYSANHFFFIEMKQTVLSVWDELGNFKKVRISIWKFSRYTEMTLDWCKYVSVIIITLRRLTIFIADSINTMLDFAQLNSCFQMKNV